MVNMSCFYIDKKVCRIVVLLAKLTFSPSSMTTVIQGFLALVKKVVVTLTLANDKLIGWVFRVVVNDLSFSKRFTQQSLYDQNAYENVTMEIGSRMIWDQDSLVTRGVRPSAFPFWVERST